jgi:large subunit ribosomal protein L29
MKLDTMRNKSVADLEKESLKLRAKLAGLRKDLLVNDVKENSQIGKVRKDIARIETIKREKELSTEGDKA